MADVLSLSLSLHCKLLRTNNWNIDKIKQLELENQNLIPLMTNTHMRNGNLYHGERERQGKEGDGDRLQVESISLTI